MSLNVHNIAVSGFGEGTNDAYDKARPSYPPASLHKIHSSLPQSSSLTILEPGSGTGIFTRLLLHPPEPSYPSFSISKLISIEPSSGMRNAWTRGMSKISKEAYEGGGREVKTVEGSYDDFSKSGVGKGSADGVIIAQAWHWCQDYDKALREIHSYLKSDGPLILIWNIESNQAGYHADLRTLIQARDLGTPQYYRGWWRKCYETDAYKELFEPAEETTSEWSLGMTEDQLVDRFFSKSYLTEAHLNGQDRVEFEEKMRGIIRGGDKEWADKDKGTFLYKYNTDVIVIRKKKV